MFGADPVLTLALVVWPNEKVTVAQISSHREALQQSERSLDLPGAETG